MLVDKIINNNVVSAKDKGKEVIIMGKGIGFRAKRGEPVERDRIEKIFKMETEEASDEFKMLLKNLPLKHLQLSNQIISYTKEVLDKKLNQNIYITLTDHINFAIERYKQNMMFHNALLWEVKTFYKREFIIGEYAVKLINRELRINLPIDEAASIALHIVNAEYNSGMSETIKGTRMIPEILEVIKSFYSIPIDETSLYYEQFVVHIKFLIERVLKKEVFEIQDSSINQTIFNTFPRAFECSQKVAYCIEQSYESNIGEEELANLTLHINKLAKE